MHHADREVTASSQCLCQRDELPLRSAVTEVTNEKNKAAWGGIWHESRL